MKTKYQKTCIALFSIIVLSIAAMLAVILYGCGEASHSTAKGNPVPTVQEVWACSKAVHDDHPFKPYIWPRRRSCAALEAKKYLNCVDTATLQFCRCAWIVPTELAGVCRYEKRGISWEHSQYCVDLPEGLTLFDRNYGKGYPKMPMLESEYLKRFNGKVSRVERYTPRLEN